MNFDEVVINFSQERIWLLNFCLSFIMFGVALDLQVKDFQEVIRNPKSTLLGVFSQVVLLPAFTFILVYLLNPAPPLALGLLLLAACPGGNMSNYISHLAKANVALSVSLTSINTLLAVFTTPFNFIFWANLSPSTRHLTQSFSISAWNMFESILFLIIIPTFIGMSFRRYLPNFTHKIQGFIKFLSLFIFIGFVILAFVANYNTFLQYLQYILLLVFLHNSLALALGYFTGIIARLPLRDARTISIETGIQNAGLGLVLIFNFFEGNGGMALIAGWWGIWHLISGSALAYYWGKNNE